MAAPIRFPIVAPLATAPAAKRGLAASWWFWPLLALCLAPPAAALQSRATVHSGGGPDYLLLAWVAAGFLSAVLLLVSLSVELPKVTRAVCFFPLAAGLVAAGALANTLLRGQAMLDQLILVTGVAAFLLLVLLVESVTVARHWRLWAWLVLLMGLVGGAVFAR